MLKKLVLLFIVTSTVSATPVEFDGNVNCTITEYSQVKNVTRSCTNIVISNLKVPAKTVLELALQDETTLQIKGIITFDYFEWKGPLVHITGNHLQIRGEEGHMFNGQGELYWDGLGGKGVTKPKFIKVETNNSIIENIYVKNCPVHCISITSHNLTMSRWNIDVSEGDKNNFTGHNTDGFDISGSANLLIKDSIVRNQDDCVAINQGNNITISNISCYGGHGLSISVGFSNTDFNANSASNLLFENSLVYRSPNGIHVKTHSDSGNGLLSNITYRNITIEKIANFGINIQQDYSDGEATGVPGTNIPIVGLTLDNIHGYMKSLNHSPTLAEYILCGEGVCYDWEFKNIEITGAQNASSCNYTPDGYTCHN